MSPRAGREDGRNFAGGGAAATWKFTLPLSEPVGGGGSAWASGTGGTRKPTPNGATWRAKGIDLMASAAGHRPIARCRRVVELGRIRRRRPKHQCGRAGQQDRLQDRRPPPSAMYRQLYIGSGGRRFAQVGDGAPLRVGGAGKKLASARVRLSLSSTRTAVRVNDGGQ